MRQPLTISGGLVLLVTLAAFSARLGVPWTLRQALYAGAALLEAVGLVMVAWPDIEAKASAYRIDAIRRMRAFVHSLPRRLGVVPMNVVYRREAGTAPPMPPCGRRAL